MRPKKLWMGYHYGTGVDGGLVAHTVPGRGKHVSTLEGFCEGKPYLIKRPRRTPIENLAVQQRALSDLGKPYDPTTANCEHDITTAHDGAPSSPMLQSVVIGLSLGTLLWITVNSSKA